jgi:hypothetical protein
MHTQTLILPAPSKGHATCAWCGHTYEGIEALIDHVDADHVAQWDREIAR